MIQRLEQATQVFSGGSGSVTLGSVPQHGDTLLLALAQEDRPGLVASAVTQPGVTWTSVTSTSFSTDVAIHLWIGQVTFGATDTVSITTFDPEGVAAVLARYTGVARSGTIVDQVAGAYQDSYTPESGQTLTTATANQLWLGVIGNTKGTASQSDPSNNFLQVGQRTTGVAATNVVLGVYDRVVGQVGMANVAVQTTQYVNWVGMMVTFLEDTSTEETVEVGLDVVVADHVTANTYLSCNLVDVNTVWAGLSPYVAGAIQADLVCMVEGSGVGGHALFQDLEVSCDPGPDARALLDVHVTAIGAEMDPLSLDMLVVYDITPLVNELEVHVGGVVPLTAQMDVAVLRVLSPSNSVTTPEQSLYLNCRPVWCNIPRRETIVSRLAVNITT